MINRIKTWAKRHWPALRLRTILLAALLFTAAMPGIGAIFLRVYENTLVRQTEAELVAQGAALAASASVIWPGSNLDPAPVAANSSDRLLRSTTIDLRTSPILTARPPPRALAQPIQPDAIQVAPRLGAVIDRTAQTTLVSVLLLDRRGVVARGSRGGADLSNLPEVRAALAGRAQTVLRRNAAYHPRYAFEWLSRAADLRLDHARPIMLNGQVVGVLLLSQSPRALFRGLYDDRGKILIGVAIIFAALLSLSGLVSRGVTQPIEALSAASREVAAGRGHVPETPPTAAVEIRALYEDFSAMAAAIDRRSRYLRDFAAAVSHEFKTPLAGIDGAVELLQDHHDSMTEAERRRFLANIAADSRRMSLLVSRLLDLARADMTKPDLEAMTLVEPILHRVADGLAGSDARIDIVAPPGLPAVRVPEPAIEAVLTALVENSLQAGAGRVTLKAAVSKDLIISVIDDGRGVPAGDRDRLFEPFFTSRRSAGGTGLGLPIARSLLSAHHGRIDMVETAQGARFDITLPIADARA